MLVFCTDTATSEIYTLSLHDALPILGAHEMGHYLMAKRHGVRASLPFFIPSDRKSTRLNSSHSSISYAVFCLKKKRRGHHRRPARRLGPAPSPHTLPRHLPSPGRAAS